MTAEARTYGGGGPPLRGVKNAALNALRAGLLLAALGFLVVVRTGVPPLVYGGAVVVSMAAVFVTARRAADVRLWGLYILGFVLFAHLRTLADETGNAVQFAYPIEMDEALFFGQVPTVWLQDRLYSFGHTGPLEVFTMGVYLSYFVAPHLVAFAIWRVYPERFPVYVGAVLGTVYAALLVCFLLPTAPPWLAGQTGDLPHVFRVMHDISKAVSPGAYQQAYSTAGPNDVAAMPSLHTALPVVIALAMWRTQRVLAVSAVAYAGSMGFTLVYLGEHYVVDVLAGVATAVLMWAAASWVQRRVSRGVAQRPAHAPAVPAQGAGSGSGRV